MGTDCRQILGLFKLALYENKGVEFKRPDISKPNEINLIWSGSENYVITNENNPIWQREINYSGNYKPVFSDKFIYFWYGTIYNNSLYNLRKNRSGFIAEIITTDGNSFVFPAPVFVSEINQLNSNINTWEVVLEYRQPTFLDRLTKLNTFIMNGNFLLADSNSLLSVGENKVLIWK